MSPLLHVLSLAVFSCPYFALLRWISPLRLLQVCALLWSQEYKELISGHGFAQNQLTIWRYPSLSKVTDLEGFVAFFSLRG